jgi:hypothetical protein
MRSEQSIVSLKEKEGEEVNRQKIKIYITHVRSRMATD